DNITFLRKIVRGSTDDSYGIEVAKLAGVPGEVVKRAKQILATIESGSGIVTSRSERPFEAEDDSLISIDDTLRAQAMEELKNIDLNMISPYEAMQLLYEIQKKLK
ncbi:MAG: DNA mismatch repair protein MutS, partial [Clostridia bacterium]|nr:DNA mismatch repair protein MutS [Clostridia bacterium]